MSKVTKQIDVKGMYCSNCASRIEKVVGKMDGVVEVRINLATEMGQVTFQQDETNLEHIISSINHIGFEATPHRQKDQIGRGEEEILRENLLFSIVLTVPLAWGMFAHINAFDFMYVPSLFLHPFFQFCIAFPIQFMIGSTFYERAWKAIKHRSLNMDLLVVISTSAAFFYSHYLTFTTPGIIEDPEKVVLYYETSAFIITFILLGRYLEAKTKIKTTEALQKLYEMQMNLATVYKQGKEILTKIHRVVPGDIVLIKPGERIPIDGQVMKGRSVVDEALLTGESMPIEKYPGDVVYAGTINQDGLLMIKVTKKESETILSNIIKIVEDAQLSKAPIQHIADRITSYFIPIVLFIACGTFIAWFNYVEPGYFAGALVKMIAVLIVACPCALGLATPTSLMVGSGRAAQLGVLIKEVRYMELLGKCDTVLLDKTGTVTDGLPKVTNIYVDQVETKRFMQIVGAVEQFSTHPIAKAIVSEMKNTVFEFPEVTAVRNMPGFGMKAVVEGQDVIVASTNFFEKERLQFPAHLLKVEKQLKTEGKTVIAVMIDTNFAGIIATADQLKSSAVEAVTALGKLNYDVRLVSGDHRQASSRIAKKLGLKNVYSECHPAEKVRLIEQLQKKGKTVMMIGDGINDAPALAVADIGVAIGTGSDIAIESGDVTIIHGELPRLVEAIHVSRKTMTNIKQNFVWAFMYNAWMIPLAIFGVLVPWLASAAMALSSITVVLNALRLKRVRIH